MTNLIYQEAAGSADIQAEIFWHQRTLQEVLAPHNAEGHRLTMLEALYPILEAHPVCGQGWRCTG